MKINPERIDLGAAIPLTAPLSVVMESTSKCNFACAFCPTSRPEDIRRVGLKKQHMTDELYYKILADLLKFPAPLHQLHFHYDGEPLLQPNLIEWITAAAAQGVAKDYMIRTNGLLLTPDVTDRLIKSGITKIGISIEAVDDAGYATLTGRKGVFSVIRDNMHYLYSHRGKITLYAKIIDFGLQATDPQRFMELFAPLVDIATVEYPMQWNNGVKDTTYGKGVKVSVNGDRRVEHVVCPYPFYTLGISSRGQVNACCFDWSWQTTFGDVNRESLQNIWNGSRRRDFLLMHLRGQRYLNSACMDCTAHTACPDNVDDTRLEIAARLV